LGVAGVVSRGGAGGVIPVAYLSRSGSLLRWVIARRWREGDRFWLVDLVASVVLTVAQGVASGDLIFWNMFLGFAFDACGDPNLACNFARGTGALFVVPVVALVVFAATVALVVKNRSASRLSWWILVAGIGVTVVSLVVAMTVMSIAVADLYSKKSGVSRACPVVEISLNVPLTNRGDPRNQSTDFCMVVRIGTFDRMVRLIQCWWLKVCSVVVDQRVNDIGASGIFSVETHSIANYLWVRVHVDEIESGVDVRSDRAPFVTQEPWRTGVVDNDTDTRSEKTFCSLMSKIVGYPPLRQRNSLTTLQASLVVDRVEADDGGLETVGEALPYGALARERQTAKDNQHG
jgi:uncharacterized membrane protein YhaH (DUF805 family)